MKTHSLFSNWLVIIFAMLFLSIYSTNHLNAGVICVSNTGDDENPGTPELPYQNIQTALDSASAGDTIKVAAGTYSQYLSTKCSVILLGGYNEFFTNNERDIFENTTSIVGVSTMMFNDTNGSETNGFHFICNSSVTGDAIKVSNNSYFSQNVIHGYASSSINSAIYVSGGATVVNNSIKGGWKALSLNSGEGTPNVRNNIMTGTSFGLSTISFDASVRTYNNVYGNTHNYTGFDSNPGVGDISQNPQFRNVDNNDFRILEESACVDAGDPSDSPGFEPAPYNTRIDIGAYGGTIYSPYLTPIPNAPLLSTPINNLENAPRTITLKWNDIEEVDSFQVQVATDPTFTTGIVLDNNSVSDTIVDLSDLLYNTTYYWRVNASVTLGTSDWSEVWHFSTIELDQPVLYLPANGKINPDGFLWYSTLNADKYNIQISTDSIFAGIVLDSTLSDTTFVLDSLDNNLYYWRIKAFNAVGESPWSMIRNFTIDNDLLFYEDFESYPLGILANAPGSPWIRYSSSREGTIVDNNVHSGEKCFQINSFTTSTEIDYVKFDWASKPAQLNLELWYNPDGFFIYKDFAELGLGFAASKFDMDEFIGLWGSDHNVWFSAEGRVSDTIVFNELEYDKYNYIKVEFDFQDNEARVYIGLDSEAPLRATVSFNGTIDINSLYFAGDLNPTYIDDIYVTVEGEYILPLPQPPVLLSPANGSIEQNTTLTLNWQPALTADSYHIQIDDTIDFSSPLFDQQNITATSHQLINLDYNKTYYWHVSAKNASGTSVWSDTWNFITLVTPICDRDWIGFNPPVAFDYTSGNKYNVKITLTDVGLCSKLEIEVMSVTMDDNVSISYSYPNNGSLSGSVSADGNTISGSYNIGNSNCGGSKSGSWSASKLTLIPDKPTLINPINNAVDQPVDITLTWDEVDKVAGYALEVSESDNFETSILSVANTLTNSYDISSLNKNTTYYWKVGSINVCDEINWSEIRNFTTINPVGINISNSNKHFRFFPNPVNNVLYFEGIENEITEISVLTIDGKILKQMNEKGINQIDLSDLQKGTYLLKIINSKIIYFKKIIKQ